MREVFILTGLSSSARKDGDTDVTVTLKTQVSPDYAGALLAKLTPLAHRFIIANLEKQQAEIDLETGEELTKWDSAKDSARAAAKAAAWAKEVS